LIKCFEWYLFLGWRKLNDQLVEDEITEELVSSDTDGEAYILFYRKKKKLE
jgi:hypothetical protein